MRLIIAGGRDYILTEKDWQELNHIDQTAGVSRVICGGAKGADLGGAEWGNSREIQVEYFPADWNKLGKAAGPIRNRQMAERAHALALFPGGRGTANMLAEAIKAGLRIFDFRKLHGKEKE